ncbi:MAG: glycosyltransferase family 4 protein, partial [Armatimonadota bacterium]
MQPLRILEIGSCFDKWGGAELHTLNLSEELSKRGHDVSIVAQPGSFVEDEARKRGVPMLPMTIRHKQAWSAAPQMRRLIEHTQADVVHVHGIRDYLVPPAVAHFSGVPAVVMTRHFPKKFRPHQRWLYGGILLDHVIAVSESVRQVLLTNLFDPDRVTTV